MLYSFILLLSCRITFMFGDQELRYWRQVPQGAQKISSSFSFDEGPPTTAIFSKFFCPSERAFIIAQRSAHMFVTPIPEGSSMLQPFITFPSFVSRAAPTLKFDISTHAFFLASFACSISCSLVIWL